MSSVQDQSIDKNEKSSIQEGTLSSDLSKKDESVKAPDEAERQAPALSLTSRLVIFASICLGVFLSSLDETMVSILVPTLSDEFHSLDTVGWYGSV